jgi:RimJ/RimL family protein N-acetyltransferase
VIRLYALCHPEHRPSRRVLEKCGFVQDDPATRRAEFPNLSPGIEQDALCYVLAFDPGRGDAG